MSVDGKISSGASDALDVDSDWKRISGVRDGLSQYYDLEQETDLFSLNSGRTWAKIGFNEKTDVPPKTPVTFIVIDNKPHLSTSGVDYAAKKAKKLIIVTTNHRHPALGLRDKHPHLSILQYDGTLNFINMMRKLRQEFGVDRLTVQTGGTLNSELLGSGLIDRLLIVVAPILVGGQATPSLVSGSSITKIDELKKLKTLTLENCKPLRNSFLQLEYKVSSETLII